MNTGKLFFMAAATLMLLASPAFAGGNAAQGKQIFERCAICHTVARNGPNGVGPDLFGVVGRKAASEPNFYYSPALKHSGIVWTPAKLNAWIAAPSKLVPGNRMAFEGISDPAERADVIAYLETLK
jgi:cytochrome c